MSDGEATVAYLDHVSPAFTLRLVEGLREVVALHHEEGVSGDPWNRCAECKFKYEGRDEWPCPTIAALTRALVGEEEG